MRQAKATIGKCIKVLMRDMSVRNILKTAALVLFRVMLIVIALPLNAILLLVNNNKS